MSDEDHPKTIQEKIMEEVADILERQMELQRELAEQGKLFHQQLTLTFGTLGAITFAGLVLILQDPKPFTVPLKFLNAHQSFVFLVLMLSGVSILALISCLATSFVAAGIAPMLSGLGKFGYFSGLASIGGFVFSLLVMVNDISPNGGTVLGVFIIAVLAVFGTIAFMSIRRMPSENSTLE